MPVSLVIPRQLYDEMLAQAQAELPNECCGFLAGSMSESEWRVLRRYPLINKAASPVEDWGKLLGDVAAVTAMLDRLLHHGHVLKCGPKSWRTKTAVTASAKE